MHEVLEKVLAAEIEAKGIVVQAHQEADTILHEAQIMVKEILTHSSEETRLGAERILAVVAQECEIEKRRKLASADAEIEEQVRLDPTTRQHIVSAVVRCVCAQR